MLIQKHKFKAKEEEKNIELFSFEFWSALALFVIMSKGQTIK